VDGVDFHGFVEHSAASMHEYHGIFLHAFRNETCYEIGYGVATVGASGTSDGDTSSSSGNLKNVNQEHLLHKLERALENVRINSPDFERNTATD
jgi:hypothetical protein